MVTRDDVAKYAGVSKATVSRVINNNGYVSEENRKKVEEGIEKLGFRPNLIARSLKTNETRQVLFHVEDLSNPFYMELYKGMDDFAVKNGYTIVVSSHFDKSMITQRRFDGVILSGIPKGQEDYLTSAIPAVVTNFSGKPTLIPSVGIDIENGINTAMDYLIEKGHRDICYCGYYFNSEDVRCKGYKTAIEKLGIAFDPEKVLMEEVKNNYFEAGYMAGLRYVERKLKSTAVFAFNDAFAIGVISALENHGFRVPEDISVIGFDNIIQSNYTTPPLTTINIPKYEQGEESMKMLLEIIKGKAVKPILLKTNLVERKSVKNLSFV